MTLPNDGGKGDDRRPGKIPPGAWEAIFNKKPTDPFAGIAADFAAPAMLTEQESPE